MDVLRKRRNHHDASDEDLGLPRSPITSQQRDRIINESQGSLSMLSIISSDIEDDLIRQKNTSNSELMSDIKYTDDGSECY